MKQLFIALHFIFGTILGSFLNVVILRLPKDETLGGRSHCMHCGYVLQATDLVPILSFLFLKGQCRNCKKRISARYFLIELATGLLFGATYAYLQPQDVAGWLTLLAWLIFICACIVTVVIDFEHYVIFDIVVYPAIAALYVLVIAAAFFGGSAWPEIGNQLAQALLGAAVGAAPFYFIWRISKGAWMGFGDVKLMLLLGSMAGIKLVGVTFLLAVFAGGIVSVILLAFFKKTMQSKIPFGVFLAPAGVVTLFFGHRILAWYLSILGF